MPTDDWERGFAAGWIAAGGFIPAAEGAAERAAPTLKKKKRKASAYNKRYAKEYRLLKKKHPRTSFAALAKKAHAATRKAMK